MPRKQVLPTTKRANFNLPADEYNMMHAAASLDGKNFSDWARAILVAAARERVWEFAKKRPLPTLGTKAE